MGGEKQLHWQVIRSKETVVCKTMHVHVMCAKVGGLGVLYSGKFSLVQIFVWLARKLKIFIFIR